MAGKVGTGNTNRVKRKEGREATRARKWGERVEAKEEKRTAVLRKKRSNMNLANDKKVAVNTLKREKSANRKEFATMVKTEKQRPGKARMDTIAGRTRSGKRTAGDQRVTIGRTPVKEISEVRADIRQARRVRKRNTK